MQRFQLPPESKSSTDEYSELQQRLAQPLTKILTKSTPNSTNPPCQLYVFLLNCDSLRVDRAQIRVREKMDHERLTRFLQSLYRLTLPSQRFFASWEHVDGYLSNLEIAM